jgi:hypothetical protein
MRERNEGGRRIFSRFMETNRIIPRKEGGVMKKNKTKNWYRYTHRYCPSCGRERSVKELVRDEEKPKDYKLRHIEYEVYDYCDSF